ncbi:MAG: hypothetical protein ACJ8F7_08390, partial [Gemmataceae bacterium]
MNPTPTSHPSLLDLAALRAGRLGTAAATTLEQHLATCPACSTTLQQVPAETLRALLDSAGATPAPPPRADATIGARPRPSATGGPKP